MTDRRYSKRIKLNIICTLFANESEYLCTVQDISLTGICFSSNKNLDIANGSIIKFQFVDIDNANQIILGTANVVRVQHNDDKTLVGCKIVRINDDNYVNLKEALNYIKVLHSASKNNAKGTSYI